MIVCTFMLVSLLLFASPVAQDRRTLPAADPDLSDPRVDTGLKCKPSAGEEVVICGTTEQPRANLQPRPEFDDKKIGPRIRLPGGGEGSVHLIQSTLPGATGQGAAVTVKFPFGKGKRKDADE